MASLAASIVASMIIDDMLKDDGGAEATQLMEGDGYKRRTSKTKQHGKMGGVVAKTVIRQAAKQAAKQVTKRVTKQAVKRIAIRGAKELGKGAAVAAVGVGADAALNQMRGGGKRKRRKHRRRKTIKGSRR